MLSEQKARLIIIITREVVIKYPPAMLCTARLVNQQAGLVILAGGKVADPASGAMFLP